MFEPRDENFVVQAWLDSFATGQYGHRFRTRTGGRHAAMNRTWEEHRDTVINLIRNARVDVICDAEDQKVIYAWSCTGDGVVHYALAKIGAIAEGLGNEMLTKLLGDRFDEQIVLTHEPVWVRHVKETRATYVRNHPNRKWSELALAQDASRRRCPPPPDVLLTDNGAQLPYYYQPHASFFPLPQSWKLDEYYLAHKWCPRAA